jgi:hypothetical protein
MYRPLFAVVAALVLAGNAQAASVQVPVTPDQLEYSNFVFAVATVAATNGAAFHVTITGQTGAIPDDCATSLAVMDTEAKTLNIAGLVPATAVTVTKTARVWQADFTASQAVLDQPDAYFILVATDQATNLLGERLFLPSDRIYELRLQDFWPPED